MIEVLVREATGAALCARDTGADKRAKVIALGEVETQGGEGRQPAVAAFEAARL